ncbi:MAG: methyl-accepting chemotaxis protein [Proteobacteria bacterium]|nr:methyl-accepting chemotaxis protein [Pseudomonadota bacterium]
MAGIMKTNLSLKKKFLIPTLTLMILGMLISSIISYQKSRTAIKEALIGQTTQIAEFTIKFLTAWMNDRKIEVLYWSEIDIFKTALKDDEEGEAARTAANAYMKKLKDSGKYYEDICIADLSGSVIAASTPDTVGKLNISDRQYFKESRNGNIVISDILKSRLTGNPITSVSAPIKINGKIEGVLFSVVALNSFSHEFIDPIKVGENGYGYIYNQEGYIVVHPDKNQILKLNMKTLDFGQEMMKMENGTITYVWNGAEKIVVFRKDSLTGWTLGVGGFTSEIFAPINRLRSFNILFSAFIVLLTGTLIFFIANSVVKPINSVVAGLKDAAEGEGDLTKRLTVASKDEVGELARWFNIFIEKIQTIITEVAQNAGQLTVSSKELAAVSAQMSSGANQMSTKATAVSTAGEEMSISMNTVADAMDQTTGNINMVAASTEEMETTINEIALNTEKARETTHEAVKQTESVSKQMGTLGNAAQEIEKVIGAITEISAQVNLLALNATIEAARAGEAGKGFAVVANEIKDLAMQTSGATGEIKQRVEAIQNSTESTVKEMAAITSVINNVNEIVTTIASAVEEQSIATREISGNLSQASTNMNEVNTNVSQSSDVSKDIASEISELTRTISEMANSSSKVNKNSSELSRMAEKLNSMVGRFKVTAR